MLTLPFFLPGFVILELGRAFQLRAWEDKIGSLEIVLPDLHGLDVSVWLADIANWK